jgi:hypothetical protein
VTEVFDEPETAAENLYVVPMRTLAEVGEMEIVTDWGEDGWTEESQCKSRRYCRRREGEIRRAGRKTSEDA